MKDFFYDELNKEVGIVGNLEDNSNLDSSEYIYGNLNKLVEQKEYKGSSTDTIEVTIDNKTNTISADLLATNIATTDYVDTVNKKTVQYVDTSVKNLSDNLNEKITNTSSQLQSNIDTLGNRVTDLENEDKEFDTKIEDLSNRITTNAESITKEVEDRTNADSTLQSNIDQVNTKITNLKTSEIENDGDGISPFTTQTYVEQQIPIKSISVNSSKLIPDGVKDVALPIGSLDTYGVFKSGNGISSFEGILTTDKATEEDIEAQLDNYKPIVSSNYKYAVENIVGKQSDIQSGETNLVNAVNKLTTDLSSEITTRTNADTDIQDQIDWLKENSGKIDSISLNETPLAIDENKNVEITINKSTVGLSNVDNTSDIDKPVSTAQLNALDLKLDKSKSNLNMAKDINVTTNGDNVYLDIAYKNLTTGDENTNQKQLTLASDTQAGLMSMADYAQIRDNTSRIEQLEGQNIRLLYSASETPDEVDIRNFVISSGYAEVTQWATIGVVIQGTNHIWRYYDNTQHWEDIGVDTVTNFTNEIAGIIKGSEVDGKVYAETDGTGSVHGWGNLLGRVTDNESNITSNTTSITSLQNSKLNKAGFTASQNVVTDSNGNIVTEAKPTIPTVNNSSITINKNGTSVGTFTLNQSTNGTINITNVQDTLVSGTNIKTINGTSILGSGDISITAPATDVRINNTSITSNGIANIVTMSAYNASTNKIATKNDLPPTITINNSVVGSESISNGINTINVATRDTAQILSKKSLTQLNYNIGTCNTANTTNAAVVSLPNFVATEYSEIWVSFANTLNKDNITMNVNNTGAYPVIANPFLSNTTVILKGVMKFILINNNWLILGYPFYNTFATEAQHVGNNLILRNTSGNNISWNGSSDVTLSDYYVDLSQNQTIKAKKTFNNGINLNNASDIYLNNNSDINFQNNIALSANNLYDSNLILNSIQASSNTVGIKFQVGSLSIKGSGIIKYDASTDTFSV